MRQAFATRSRLREVLGAAAEAESRVLVGTALEFPLAATINLEGDAAEHWYEVASGAVRTVKMDSGGRRQIVEFFLPGDLFGFDDLGGVHSLSAEAASVRGSVVIRRCRRRLDQLAAADPLVLRWLLSVAQLRAAQAHMRLLMLGRMDAVERLAAFLIEMSRRLAEPLACGEGTSSFCLPVMGRDIADHLGLTVETVSRSLGLLRQRGAIALPGNRHVKILDRKRLRTEEGRLDPDVSAAA
jgi:CRP-like cAMP-binding protein